MKVLIISHNSFSSHQSMGKTFLSLFSEFKKEELCQLYIYPTIPDVDVCGSYYRITDKEVLNSFCKLKKPGREILQSEISLGKHSLFENPEDMVIYKKTDNRTSPKRLLRDLMWKLSRWYTKDLKMWLEKEAPTCIFLAPGYAKLIYDIALKISKDCNIPIVTYICDDYYFVKNPEKFIDQMQLFLLKNKINTLMSNTSHLITINSETEKVYYKKFGINTTTIMTGTNYTIRKEMCLNDNPTAISYFGNVGCNRYTSLVDIGRALDKINQEKNTDYSLKIYTAEKNTEILKSFEGINSIRLQGFITGDEFDKTMHASDMLLHTEAFDAESIDLVKHSISTKIADSLGSGIPLFVYGPDTVASVSYLIQNECAFIAKSKDQIVDMFLMAMNNKKAREVVVNKALKIAHLNHDCKINSITLRQIMGKIEV